MWVHMLVIWFTLDQVHVGLDLTRLTCKCEAEVALTWRTHGFHVDSTAAVAQEPKVTDVWGHSGVNEGTHREDRTTGVSSCGLRMQGDDRVDRRRGLRGSGATDFGDGELWRCSGNFKVAVV